MPFTASHLYFDDVEVGQEWESQGRTVTEADIVNFAGLSGDFNPIHVDHEFAKTTPFRKPIAHGLLVWTVSSGLAINAPPMRTLALVGIREWEFKGPVFIGDTVTLTYTIAEVDPQKGQSLADIEVMNQNGVRVAVARHILRWVKNLDQRGA